MTASLLDRSSFRLVFDDEFDMFTSSPNGSRGWMTAFPYGGGSDRTLPGNREAEYYTDPSIGVNPFSLDDGVLTISATATPAGSLPYDLAYNSGLITTYGLFAQTYGYFEVRAELPAGKGLWPAFWLLPADNRYSSELDVFEMLGNTPTSIHVGMNGSESGVWKTTGQWIAVPDTSAGFHTYGVDWEAQTTTFTVDDQIVFSAPTPASMNVPMYMLLNLAVGGPRSWPGVPNVATPFPAEMNIDYVRAYATPGTIAMNAGAPASVTVGAGPDTIIVRVSEDAYLGDANFTISVDSKQVGGVQTTSALNVMRETQNFVVQGNFPGRQHWVTVNFLNDASGGNAWADRNLYLESVSYAGVDFDARIALLSAGSKGVIVTAPGPAPVPVTIGSGQIAFVLGISEDAYLGDANFSVSIDGSQVGGVQVATATHAAKQSQLFTVKSDIPAGQHTVRVEFLNDLYRGTWQTDRNLFIDSISFGGGEYGLGAALTSAGGKTFSFTSYVPPTPPPAPSTSATTAPSDPEQGASTNVIPSPVVTDLPDSPAGPGEIPVLNTPPANAPVDGGGTPSAPDPVVPAKASLTVQAYDWRSHALLNKVSLSILGRGSVDGAISLRAVHLGSGSSLVAEVWADAGDAARNVAFAFSLSSGGNPATSAPATFTPSATLESWSVSINSAPGQLGFSGFTNATPISGQTSLGTLSIALPGGLTDLRLGLAAGEVGGAVAAPFTLSYAAPLTGADGTAILAAIDLDDYSVSGARGTDDAGRAITAADALAALKLSVGLNPNAAPDASGRVAAPSVSPYQLLAADMNGDGRVTAADALAILKVAVKQPAASTPRWIFVDEATSFWDPVALRFTSSPASITPVGQAAVSVPASNAVRLVGVLTGAVLGHWAPLDTSGAALAPDRYAALPTSYFQALSRDVGTPVGQWGYGVAVAATAVDAIPVAAGIGAPAAPVAIYDTAAAIAASLDQLQAWYAAGQLAGVTFMETTTPIVRLSVAQFAADGGALSMASGVYRLDIVAGANEATLGLSGNAMAFTGPVDTVSVGSSATTVHYLLDASAGVERIAGFRPGIDRLDLDLNGHTASDLVASDVLVAGAPAVAIRTVDDLTHGVVLTGTSAGFDAASLAARHLIITDGHALIG